MQKNATRDKRIKKVKNALKKLLKTQNLPDEKLKTVDGMIQRVAFMQITLEDLEADINKNGTTELFSQTPGVKYQRERPASAIYNKLIKNYSTACKQIFDLLPDEKAADIPKGGEKLMQFIAGGGK
jgi:hypothetical protein